MLQNFQTVSKYETTSKLSSTAAVKSLTDKLRDKGWTVRDAALYLGVSRQRLYSVFADREHERLWDCAIQGMPRCSPALAKEIKALRLHQPASKPIKKNSLSSYQFAIGDVVVCDHYAGIADDGDEGVIADIRQAGKEPEILVRMPEGEDWFSLSLFHKHFLTTGR